MQCRYYKSFQPIAKVVPDREGESEGQSVCVRMCVLGRGDMKPIKVTCRRHEKKASQIPLQKEEAIFSWNWNLIRLCIKVL